MLAVPDRAGDVAAVRAAAHLAITAGRHGRTVLPRIRREWTGPKEGAVKVANTHGWPVMDSGMPLPPVSPARTSCRASRLYTVEHGGQMVSRRFPQGTCRTPPGSSVAVS